VVVADFVVGDFEVAVFGVADFEVVRGDLEVDIGVVEDLLEELVPQE
jgi:hypothetical protein